MTTERRFQSTAEYYIQYRPRYPQALINAVAELLALDGRRRLLDLGCGPGFLALAFAPWFEAVVGMDPEPEMLAAAEAEARAAGITRALVLGGSEDLGPHLGRFRLVTMGRSFHWMDRDRTLVRSTP
jgi:tRNA/tmRNA/rRNA uracil-C5-methylase (TrmA/RlmC/RlmD family)